MHYINLAQLNDLEKQIYQRLSVECKKNKNLRINQAADFCQCSTSKISKTIKKMGFSNYKQFIAFINDEYVPAKPVSSEFKRIVQFLDNFDPAIMDTFIDLLDHHNKILLFGYGPSRYCAEYLAFKLRLLITQNVITISDELSADSLIDDNTLLVIFSATGSYASFDNLKEIVKEHQATLLMLVEEYNPAVISDDCQVLFLTDSVQTFSDIPYEKSRIVFYIFIEEVMQHLILRKRELLKESSE